MQDNFINKFLVNFLVNYHTKTDVKFDAFTCRNGSFFPHFFLYCKGQSFHLAILLIKLIIIEQYTFF